MFFRIVFLINKLGEKSRLVNLEVADFKGKVEVESQFMFLCKPWENGAGSKIRVIFTVGINNAMGPVRRVGIG